VHGLFPVFVQCGVCDERDAAELRRLRNRLKLYFSGSLLVPLLAVHGNYVAIVTSVQSGVLNATMFIVIFGGIGAAGVTYTYFRDLETDLAALERVVSGRLG
jgi:eukaryotic-like serine/threonine-protein kinase